MYGLVPILGSKASTIDVGFSYVVYAFSLALIASIILSVVAIFNPKKSAILSKIATYIFTWCAIAYTVTLTAISVYVGSIKATLDASTMLLALAGAITYFYLMFKESRHKAWGYTAQFALAFAVLGLFVLAIVHNPAVVVKALRKQEAYQSLIVLAGAALLFLLALSTLCVFCKKYAYLSLAIALFQSLIILCTVFLGQTAKINDKAFAIFLLIASLIAFVQILISCALVLIDMKNNTREELNAFIGKLANNEYVEVYPYDGSKPAEVYVAELAEEAPADPPAENNEETPTEAQTEENAEIPAENAEEPAPVADAFIASLSDEERTQFTDLYILKMVNMPEIPAYQVGGNNKAFFTKVFIYLGEYREKIPNSLLAKMYDFSVSA